MLKLRDLINLTGVRLGNFKIHCATGEDPTPLEAFYSGEFKEWQEYQTNPNFKCDNILSLISMGGNIWLFAGIFKVNGYEEWSSRHSKDWWFKNNYRYYTKELKGLEDLAGKAVISFEKNFRNSYLVGENHIDLLLVKEIKPERQNFGDFPGFNLIALPYSSLKLIVNQELPSWKAALGNVAGIYLIADKKKGKQYVGSAYGKTGIWQRWCEYAKTGHGKNKELSNLISAHSIKYADYFVFTLLEVMDINTSKEFMISRENHWKDVLLTREFGYNNN